MTDNHDETPDTPSTELVAKVDWLRTQLEQVQATAQRAVETRKVGPLDEWVNVLRDYDQLAQTLARTEFVPLAFRGKPEPITAAMMYGREIGLPPLTTLQNTHVIHGRVGMYAEQLRAMILAAGHEYVIEESTSDRCVISGRRKNSDRWQTHTYTMDQAKLAGLWAQNDQYKKRPTEMMLARCSAIMAHAQFPDVIRGMSAMEEIDVEDVEAPAAVEPVKSTSTVQRKPRKAVTKGDDATPSASAKPDTYDVPDAPGLPPLPGEESAPTSIRDEPARRTESQVISGAAPGPTASMPPEGEAARAQGSSGAPQGAPDEPAESVGAQRAAVEAMAAPAQPRVEGDPADDQGAAEPGVGWTRQDESGPVEDKPKPMTPADTRLLQARFRSLGYTDEPDDREARLKVATVLAGRDPEHEVTTFRHGQPNSLDRREVQAILKGLADCRDRDDVLELMVRLSQDRDAEEGS